MTPIYEEKHAGCDIKIYPDEAPENPIKDWDVLGQFACFHRRYNLGNVDFADPEDLMEHLKETKALYWPLYLFDHSGLSISMDNTMYRMADSAGWDWGQVGVVFVERETAIKEFGKKILTQRVKDKVLKCIQSEVETYDQYLRGDVYGFVVERGEDEDSCWGFFGYEYCLKEARSVAEYMRRKKLKDHIEKVKQWIKHRVPLQYRTTCPVT